ncbi:MAG TPA: pitrilysin family protein [Methylomirabilota bacterium]
MTAATAGVEGEYHKTTLPNGIRLVTERIPHVRSVAVGVWVETGSRYEPLARTGISHFIEHLVFKGTETRSAEEIARDVDSVGGQMDAFTTKEHTCFYVTVLDEHLPLAADLLADILLRPRFDTGDIEREKTVVLQEFGMVEDTPDDVIHDLFAERVWPEHPLGRPILGDRKVVQALDRSTVLAHFRAEYCPTRITVAAAGHVRHERLVELLGTRLLDFQQPPPFRANERPTLSTTVDLIERPLEQVHFVLGGRGLEQDAPERYVLFLLNTILGGSMSSRLFQVVREREGLVYSIHSGNSAFRDSGLFYVYAGTEPANFRRVIDLTLRELRTLRANGVTADELRRAKDHLKGSLMLSLESTGSRMTRIAKQELYFGRPFTFDEILADIERVTVADLGRLAERLLGEPLSLVALGPKSSDVQLPDSVRI